MEALDSLQDASVGQVFNQRCKRTILLRFGFESPDGRGVTLEEAGKEFGVTRERMRQIEAKALRLLRDPSRTVKLKVFMK